MGAVNKVILIGNLGADPDVRTLESGVKVATLSLATSETWKDKNGEKQTSTEWHRLVFWRGIAEVVEKYLKKGAQIYIEGRLRTRKYDKDGVDTWTTEIEVRELQMLGKKEDGSSTQAPPAPTEKQAPAEGANKDNPEDDLPF